MFMIEFNDSQEYSNMIGVCEIPDNIYTRIDEQSSIPGLGFRLSDTTVGENGVPLEYMLAQPTNELLSFDFQDEIVKKRLLHISSRFVKTKVLDNIEYRYVEVFGSVIVFKTVPDGIELWSKDTASYYPVVLQKRTRDTESILRFVAERQFDPYIVSTMTPEKFYEELKNKVDSELGKTINSSVIYHTPYYYRYQLNKMTAQDKSSTVDLTSNVSNLQLTRNEIDLPSYDGLKPGSLFVKSSGETDESYDNTVLKELIDNVFQYIEDSIGSSATGEFSGVSKETTTCHSSCFK